MSLYFARKLTPVWLVCFATLVAALAAHAEPANLSPRLEMDLSGKGWRLWLDKTAQYWNDKLYFPSVDVKSLPVNPPTIGWDKLYGGEGIPVSVPGTVEQYYWDKIAAANKDPNAHFPGDYKGVSWWWRNITLPHRAQGKRVILHFEAVRLRAEVFLNNELVGYDVVGNTPFDVDVTGMAKPGTNKLAVRVTDPCGNFNWCDGWSQEWGNYKIPASHGFGGIFQPVSVRILDPVHISDIFIKNKPAITAVDVDVTLNNTTGKNTDAAVELVIKEAGNNGRVVYTGRLGHC